MFTATVAATATATITTTAIATATAASIPTNTLLINNYNSFHQILCLWVHQLRHFLNDIKELMAVLGIQPHIITGTFAAAAAADTDTTAVSVASKLLNTY